MTACLAYLVSFALTLVLGYFVLNILRTLHAGQYIREDGPQSHQKKAGTPTMGGVMFILGAAVAVFALGLPFMLRGSYVHLHTLLLALSFGMIGAIDDVQKLRHHQNEGLTARQKFLLQLLVSIVFLTIMRHEGFLRNALYIPGLNVSFSLNWYVYLVFAAFVIVGCVNAVNLTDGVDGLAACVTLVVMVFFAAVGLTWDRYGVQSLFPAALAGGLSAFLFYNAHPAQVFMGDTGSLFLGGAVAALAFAMDMPLILIPVGVIYIAETLSDIIQVTYYKATHGKRIFRMAPLHHHFEMGGWSEWKVVGVFTLITAVCCLAAYFAVRGRYAG